MRDGVVIGLGDRHGRGADGIWGVFISTTEWVKNRFRRPPIKIWGKEKNSALRLKERAKMVNSQSPTDSRFSLPYSTGNSEKVIQKRKLWKG